MEDEQTGAAGADEIQPTGIGDGGDGGDAGVRDDSDSIGDFGADAIEDALADSLADFEGGDDEEGDDLPDGVTDGLASGDDSGDDGGAEAEGDSGDAGDAAPSDEVDPQVAALLARIDALEQQIGAKKDDEAEDAETPQAEADAPAPFEPPAVSLTDEDYDQAFASREGFERVMQKVASASQEQMYAALQQFNQAIPAVVVDQILRAQRVQSTLASFWKENSDLRPVQKQVTAAIQDVQSERPDLSLSQALAEAGQRVRAQASELAKVAQQQHQQPPQQQQPQQQFAGTANQQRPKRRIPKEDPTGVGELDAADFGALNF